MNTEDVLNALNVISMLLNVEEKTRLFPKLKAIHSWAMAELESTASKLGTAPEPENFTNPKSEAVLYPGVVSPSEGLRLGATKDPSKAA